LILCSSSSSGCPNMLNHLAKKRCISGDLRFNIFTYVMASLNVELQLISERAQFFFAIETKNTSDTEPKLLIRHVCQVKSGLRQMLSGKMCGQRRH